MEVRGLGAAVIVFLSGIVNLASGSCTQVFPALSIGGVQYSVQPNQNFPPAVVSGLVSLNLQFRTIMEAVQTFSGVSLSYTVDNQAASPVLTNNFGWNLDTSTLHDGTHSLSVLYVNEPTPDYPCYTFLGRQYIFVVSNSGLAVTGPQLVPATLPPPGYGPVVPQYADFVTYPGYQPHSSPHPFAYQFVAPASGITPANFWIEPLLKATSNTGETAPAFWRLKNGSIVDDVLFTTLLGCDDLRKPNWGFDIFGPARERRKAHFDGPQDDVSLSSYATFTANLDGPGFYGISMDGRFFLLNMDGSIQTLAGWVSPRNVTPFHYLDGSIPMASVQAQQTLIGNFDTPFYFPTDLAIDPTNHAHIFVADMNNHRIALVDLSQSPPTVSTFAGVRGQAGYRNGTAITSLFNQPSSIAVAPDRTMYVADAENAAIRKIDPLGNVTTLVGFGPGYEPPTDVVAASPLNFAPRSVVPFGSAYINYPNVVRFDSKGNLVLGETVSQTIRYIDLGASTITTIAQFSTTGSGFGEQLWLDVDRNGNIGNRDDIIATMVTGKQNGLYRVPIAGTSAVPLPTITSSGTVSLSNGPTQNSSMPWTSGPWSVAIDDKEGRLVISGVQSAGVVSLRLIQTSDPPFQLNFPDYYAGKNIWVNGTVPNFPFGSRPSFAAVHGYEGHSGLGSVLNFDDLVSMTDAQLGIYLQNGAEGSVPRPELTGNDLRNVIYFIRRTAAGGVLAVPAPNNPDYTPPVISALTSAQNGLTSASVRWGSSKPTLGFVAWGTTSGNYFGWSPIESNYSTVHSVNIANLPAGQQIYFRVRAKDQAGNQTASPEQTLILH